jgi:hypothetical protein
MLAGVRPRALVGKTTRRMAVEELADLVRVDTKLKALKRELKAAVPHRTNDGDKHRRTLQGAETAYLTVMLRMPRAMVLRI